jgi:hypothetical protein
MAPPGTDRPSPWNASIPGPVRERCRADFIAMRDRVEKYRKIQDVEAGRLPNLKKADC